jgi:hypothetical protein
MAHRLQLILNDEQMEGLRLAREVTGLPIAQIVRRGLDQHLAGILSDVAAAREAHNYALSLAASPAAVAKARAEVEKRIAEALARLSSAPAITPGRPPRTKRKAQRASGNAARRKRK